MSRDSTTELKTALSTLALEWYERAQTADAETPEGEMKREVYLTAVEELGKTVYPEQTGD